MAHLKAQNVLLPLYRKELRKVLLEYVQWMRAMKKDYSFPKVMESQKDLKDTDGFNWLESTELATNKRKFLLDRLFVKQPIPQNEDYTYCLFFSIQMYFNSISSELLNWSLFLSQGDFSVIVNCTLIS